MGRIAGQEANPLVPLDEPLQHGQVTVAALDRGRQPADGFDPAEHVQVIGNAQHGRRIDGRAPEYTFVQFAVLRQAKDLRQGAVRREVFQPLHGPRAQDQHAVRRLAPQHFLPAVGDHIQFRPWQWHGKNRGGGIADRQAGAGIADPVAIRHPDAGCRSVPGKHHVVRRVGLPQIGQFTIFGVKRARIRDLQVLLDVHRPTLAEGLPGKNIDRPGTEQ